MSNEFKEWEIDRICEIVLDRGFMDRVEDVQLGLHQSIAYGRKNGEPVCVAVWLDMDECEWKVEHRELAK